MKRSLLILCLITLILSPAVAQSQVVYDKVLAVSRFQFGYTIGLALSDLTGLPEHHIFPGFTFGLNAYVPLSGRWALTPEVDISTRGTKNTVQLLNAVPLQNSSTTIYTSNIDLPVLLQYNLSKKFSLATGAQLSFLLKANQRTTGDLSSGERITVLENLRPLMHKEGFMVPVQVGYNWRLRDGGLFVVMKLRYNIGIMEAFTTEAVESKYSSFQYLISVYMPRKHRKV